MQMTCATGPRRPRTDDCAPFTHNAGTANRKDSCRGANAPPVPASDATAVSRAELRRRRKKQQAYMFELSQARPHNMASVEGNNGARVSSVELGQAMPVGASLLDRPAKRMTKRTAKRTGRCELIEFAHRQLIVQHDEAERRLQRLKAAELQGRDYHDEDAENQNVVATDAAEAVPLHDDILPECATEIVGTGPVKDKEKKERAEKQQLHADARNKKRVRHGCASKGAVGHCTQLVSAAVPIHSSLTLHSEGVSSGDAVPLPAQNAAIAFSCCAKHNLIGCVLCSALATAAGRRRG